MSNNENNLEFQEVAAQLTVVERLKNIWKARELLMRLIGKELKVKYKNSFFGFLWTMLNPALYLVVYWVVFTKFLNNGIPSFPVYFLSGMLLWNVFSASLSQAAGSVTGNGSIVKKVAFVREVLPLSAVGTAIFHYVLQLAVLCMALVAFQHNIDWKYVWLLPIAFLILILLSAGLGIIVSALNIYIRDVQHFLELGLLVWFWMTPVIYSYSLASKSKVFHYFVEFNPMSHIVLTFQRVLYRIVSVDGNQILPDQGALWYLRNLSLVLLLSLCIFWFSIWFFGKLEANFAEEI